MYEVTSAHTPGSKHTRTLAFRGSAAAIARLHSEEAQSPGPGMSDVA